MQDAALARADVVGHGLVNVLVGMGAPEGEARRHEREFAACRTVVTAQTTDRSTTAAAILRGNQAEPLQQW